MKNILFVLLLGASLNSLGKCEVTDNKTAGAARTLVKQLAGISGQNASVWCDDCIVSSGSDDDIFGSSSSSDDDIFGSSSSSDDDIFGSSSSVASGFQRIQLKGSSSSLDVKVKGGKMLMVNGEQVDIDRLYVKVRSKRYANVGMLVGCSRVDERDLIIVE